MRVRLGHLVGHVAKLAEFSIGQGKRSGVHLFGVYTRGLSDGVLAVSRGAGVGVPGPLRVATNTWDALHDPSDNVKGLGEDSLRELEDTVAGGSLGQAALNSRVARLDWGEALRLVDMVAAMRVPIQQFVDDSICLESTWKGLRAVNKALSLFAVRWWRAFASGSKGPRVLAVNAGQARGHVGTVDGQSPTMVDNVEVLGVTLDRDLDLEAQCRKTVGKLVESGRSLAAGLTDTGFGRPFLPLTSSRASSRKPWRGLSVWPAPRKA